MSSLAECQRSKVMLILHWGLISRELRPRLVLSFTQQNQDFFQDFLYCLGSKSNKSKTSSKTLHSCAEFVPYTYTAGLIEVFSTMCTADDVPATHFWFILGTPSPSCRCYTIVLPPLPQVHLGHSPLSCWYRGKWQLSLLPYLQLILYYET